MRGNQAALERWVVGLFKSEIGLRTLGKPTLVFSWSLLLCFVFFKIPLVWKKAISAFVITSKSSFSLMSALPIFNAAQLQLMAVKQAEKQLIFWGS